MGVDKALIRIDGEALAVRVARTLVAAGATHVHAVGGDRWGLEAVGLRWLADRWPGAGPLGGTLTALGATGADLVVVAACDLVVLQPTVVRELVDSLVHTPTATAATAVVNGRRAHHLVVWRRTARTALEEAWQHGARSMRDGLAAVEVATLPVAATDLADADDPVALAQYHGGEPMTEE
ncbi:MAG: NTP transferase domain-containing protein [Acidimicrobiia bacterium]|nr:NTP transferase domain-containing protein [Acidimicrobiia bacterium]